MTTQKVPGKIIVFNIYGSFYKKGDRGFTELGLHRSFWQLQRSARRKSSNTGTATSTSGYLERIHEVSYVHIYIPLKLELSLFLGVEQLMKNTVEIICRDLGLHKP